LRGIYTLLIILSRDISVKIGCLGRVNLERGAYGYVGSGFGLASSSIEGRLMRHFHGGNKKHWHIDHLLCNPHARPVAAIFSETRGASECSLARKILSDGRARVALRGFGASDCTCEGHLVFVGGLGVSEVENLVWEKFLEVGIKPQRWPRVKD